VKVSEVARKVSLTRTNSPVPVQAACCIDLRGSAAPRFGLLFGAAAGGR